MTPYMLSSTLYAIARPSCLPHRWIS